MYNRSPDYSQYTIEELEDVLAHIDQAQFPNRYADAKTILANKRAELAKELPKHIVKEESYT